MGRRGGVGGGAKVKPDHCRYLAMYELHKTDNLIRLSLYELIRVRASSGTYDCVYNISNTLLSKNPAFSISR